MTFNFTDWLKHPFRRNAEGDGKCTESDYCFELLQLMLDSEATPEQIAYFKQHMDRCLPCYESYQLETTLRNVVKTRIQNKPVPQDLVDSIKMKIKQTI